jgi:hypothetical protein
MVTSQPAQHCAKPVATGTGCWPVKALRQALEPAGSKQPALLQYQTPREAQQTIALPIAVANMPPTAADTRLSIYAALRLSQHPASQAGTDQLCTAVPAMPQGAADANPVELPQPNMPRGAANTRLPLLSTAVRLWATCNKPNRPQPASL